MSERKNKYILIYVGMIIGGLLEALTEGKGTVGLVIFYAVYALVFILMIIGSN
jgi:hypothetical protein